MVCAGTGCRASGADSVRDQLKDAIERHHLENEVHVVTTGCFGFCEQGPIVKVYPDNILYVKVRGDDAEELVTEHAIKGRVLERLLFEDPRKGAKEAEHHHIPFYHSQVRIALRNCGVIDPENIEEYIAVGGYDALGKALFEMSPESVIDTVKQSGLRGRGGAGFPTGLKWEASRKGEGKENHKYVICNADEGDPGAFMDRSILEGDPHSVLEAMAVCGYAVGANQGIVYIRAEYPLAVSRIQKAIDQATEMGLLGNHILGSDFHFTVKLNLGAGAFVCGEETSLMNSIQGGRGEPRIKPPFPSQSGLWKSPTNINNVETLANIAPIITKGADWFRCIGTDKSPGTKVFALAGKVNNVGLVEVPMGIPLRQIIENIGGGIRNGKKFKAVQIGGPSGGCIPASELDIPIDFESLASIGCPMGSGGMIVMDEDDCMPSISKFFLEFTAHESCGKCTPCRIGNRRLLEIIGKITNGEGLEEHLTQLEDLSYIIKDSSLCGLGQGSPNPVLSTLKNFREEYEAHIRDKHCPSGTCTNLLKYLIVPEKCIGCTVCARNCPVSCIEGERKKVHVIDQDRCIKCGVCFDKCPVDAITR